MYKPRPCGKIYSTNQIKKEHMYGYLQSSYEQDLEVVKSKLAEQGILHYTTYKANHCVGVSYGRISAYYIVRNGKVVDIQID